MKIGKYVVPNSRLEVLLGALKKVDDTFKGEEGSKQDIAEILGHELKSGTLTQKVADLKTYGLLEGRKDRLRVTEVGRQAVSTDETERHEAVQLAVRNVPLWSIFLKKYGTSIGKEHFAVNLRRDTGAEQSVAEKNAKFVRNAYLQDVGLIESAGEPKEAPLGESEEDLQTAGGAPKMDTATVSREAIMYVGFPEYSRAPIEIRDKDSYSFAKQLLIAIGSRKGWEQEQQQLGGQPEEEQHDATCNDTPSQ